MHALYITLFLVLSSCALPQYFRNREGLYANADRIYIYRLDHCVHLPLAIDGYMSQYSFFQWGESDGIGYIDHAMCNPKDDGTYELINNGGSTFIRFTDHFDLLSDSSIEEYEKESYYAYYTYSENDCDNKNTDNVPYMLSFIPNLHCNTEVVEVNGTERLVPTIWDSSEKYVFTTGDHLLGYTSCSDDLSVFESLGFRNGQCYCRGVCAHSTSSYRVKRNDEKIKSDTDLVDKNIGWIIALACICFILILILIGTIAVVIYLHKHALYVKL